MAESGKFKDVWEIPDPFKDEKIIRSNTSKVLSSEPQQSKPDQSNKFRTMKLYSGELEEIDNSVSEQNRIWASINDRVQIYRPSVLPHSNMPMNSGWNMQYNEGSFPSPSRSGTWNSLIFEKTDLNQSTQASTSQPTAAPASQRKRFAISQSQQRLLDGLRAYSQRTSICIPKSPRQSLNFLLNNTLVRKREKRHNSRSMSEDNIIPKPGKKGYENQLENLFTNVPSGSSAASAASDLVKQTDPQGGQAENSKTVSLVKTLPQANSTPQTKSSPQPRSPLRARSLSETRTPSKATASSKVTTLPKRNFLTTFCKRFIFLLLFVHVILFAVYLHEVQLTHRHSNDYAKAVVELKKRIYGHDEAVQNLCKYLKRDEPSWKTIVLIGGTGVGKSYTAQIIREAFPRQYAVRQYFPPLESTWTFNLPFLYPNLIILENMKQRDLKSVTKFLEENRETFKSHLITVLAIFNYEQMVDGSLQKIHPIEGVSAIEAPFQEMGMDVEIIVYGSLNETILNMCIMDAMKMSKLELNERQFGIVKDTLLLNEAGCKGAYRHIQIVGRQKW